MAGAGDRSCPADALRSHSKGSVSPPPSPPRGAARAKTLPPDDGELARRLQSEFDREVEEKAARVRFQCKLCLDTASFDESVELDCLHRVCRSCFFSYLEVKIREKHLSEQELCCPMPGCGREITVLQVEGATRGTPLWERFLVGRAELWRPGEHEAEVLVVCPTPDCARFVADPNLDEVQCPRCSSEFCPRCLHKHPGQTCVEHEEWRKANCDEDREFEELMKEKRWQRCPCCRATIERSLGCNFMTCHSERCRGGKHFCYLCGVELTRGQHFTHFPHGLFTNACANVDRRNETALPAADWRRAGPDGNWWAGLMDDIRDWTGAGGARHPGAGGA